MRIIDIAQPGLFIVAQKNARIDLRRLRAGTHTVELAAMREMLMDPNIVLARMDHQSENRSVFGYEKRFAARLGAESERAVDIGGF